MAALLAFGLAGGALAQEADVEVEMVAPEGEYPHCGASNVRDAAAWIDAMPGANDNPTLHVTMTLDASSTGADYTLDLRSILKMNPPIYNYDLVQTASGGGQAITEMDVAYAEPRFAEPELTALVILCDGEEVAEIAPVEQVH